MADPHALHHYQVSVVLTLRGDQLSFLQQRHAAIQALAPATPLAFETLLASDLYTHYMLWLLQQPLEQPAQARAVGEHSPTQEEV